MRLSHIKLAGFKSFVEPTHIPVPGQLVGIVGPNGCGKSNVIDAVRWVLGESSAKQLRGESMQDVIFNGSTARKPVSRASVELVFDNSLGRAAGPWAQFADISIKRVLDRSGDSSYYINNLVVRRRDITDLFLGTGVGVKGYAVIEQGMISRIIEARPEEMRLYLEEAAGVSKYKERRKETAARLQDTRDNLTRVDDIRQELEQQLFKLEGQAEVARQYHTLHGELVLSQHQLAWVRQQDAVREQARFEALIRDAEVQLEADTARLRELEAELELVREDGHQAGETVHRAQGAMYEAGAEVARIEQSLQHQQQIAQRLQTRIDQLRGQAAQTGQQEATTRDDLVQWQERLEHAALHVEETRITAESDAMALPELESAFQAQQRASAEVQRQLIQAEQAMQLERTHRQHAERTMAQLQQRQSRLHQEQQTLIHSHAGALADLEISLDELQQQVQQRQEDQAAALNRVHQEEQNLRDAQRIMQDQRQALAGYEAQHQALERVQQQATADRGLDDWLRDAGLSQAPSLWTMLRIEPGWEKAVEAWLAERLQARGADASQWPQGGAVPGAELVLLDRAAGSMAPIEPSRPWTPLAAQVQFKSGDGAFGTAWPSALSNWLRGVYCAASLEQALQLRPQLAPGDCLIVPEGHRVDAHSVHYHGTRQAGQGILARQRELEQLQGSVTEARTALELARERVAELEECVAAERDQLARIRSDQAELQRRLHQLQIEHTRVQQQEERSRQRAEQLEHESTELAEQLEVEAENVAEAQFKMEELEARIEALQQDDQTRSQSRHEAELALTRLRAQVRTSEREAQEAMFAHRACQNKLSELENLLQVMADRSGAVQQQLEDALLELTSMDDAGLHDELQLALVRRAEQERQLAAARNAHENILGRQRELEQQRMATEHGLGPRREQVQDLRLKAAEARLQAERFAQELADAGADTAALAASPDLPKAGSLQQKISRIQQQIETLGAVNLAALEELAAASERKLFLDAQAADLVDAMETLENAIRRIDRETRDLLQDTFDRVNSSLQELFPMLFGGGRAELLLTGEEILDAGIQIVAQPPGKKNSTIHLLSGGEKALTALSLVFSFFRLNPAPFCLLDEVDAPLDDANTQRFCEMVKRMSEHTQFMYISHNKITMEMASQLVGVTMQEKGVSRVVAVDVQEAMRMAELSPA